MARVVKLTQEQIWRFLLKKRRCVKCKQLYTNMRSIGDCDCWQHPGVVSDGEFTCCGAAAHGVTKERHYAAKRPMYQEQLGCMPGDHIDECENIHYAYGIGVAGSIIELRRDFLVPIDLYDVEAENIEAFEAAYNANRDRKPVAWQPRYPLPQSADRAREYFYFRRYGDPPPERPAPVGDP
jgi:hypothetical protein